MTKMKGVDHSEVKKAENSRTICVSCQRARREAGFAVLFPLQIPYSWIYPAVSQCLFHPCVCLDLVFQPHTPEQMVTALVFMQTDPGNF